MCNGKLKIEKINHEVYVNNQKYTIQNIWANLCEDCGESYFDTEAAMEIEKIIELIKTETNDESIDLFLKTLGRYWKDNKELSFSDIVKTLDRKYELHRLNLGTEYLTLMLDRLILKTSYPNLREKISRVYSKELESLGEEKAKKDLTLLGQEFSHF